MFVFTVSVAEDFACCVLLGVMGVVCVWKYNCARVVVLVWCSVLVVLPLLAIATVLLAVSNTPVITGAASLRSTLTGW